MPPVLIACPDTLDLVPAGFDADDRDELEPLSLLTDCPACSADHEWTPDDAVLVESVS